MGQVYAAYDPHLDRKVALKLMHSGGMRAEHRLLREAKALARLSHRNVVPVHDSGTFHGRVFVAMAFVDGVSLRGWLAERPRPRADILAVFTNAARGLGAVHAAGLVHRDFKPGNVMVGNDGSVRVLDFGLARTLDEREDDLGVAHDEEQALALEDTRLTRTGERIGTPLFMAPEQFTGGPVDARTDQFSFCVALYRALYGVAPFGEGSIDGVMARVLTGQVEPAPASSTVPGSLRRIIVRGLSLQPDTRWPSMVHLVAALERGSARPWRRMGVTAGALAFAGLATAVFARGAAPTAHLCLGGPGHLANTWEDRDARPAPRRSAVENAFLASGAPNAHDVWQRVAAYLDRYRADWLAMYRDACEATQSRHEQAASLLDLRMACLDQRRLAISAVTDVFATADREVVARAVDAVNALPTFDRCADRRQLDTSIEPPPDKNMRSRVDTLRARAAVAKALDDAGKHVEARQLLRTQLAEARALRYQPLVAELLTAFVHTFISEPINTERDLAAEEATWLSVSVGRDDLAAETAIRLVATEGAFRGRFAEGRAWARTADALLQRAGPGNEILHAWLLTDEALLDYEQGHDFERALELLERAVAIKEKILRPDHPDLARGLNNVANVLSELGRNEEALSVARRAHGIFSRAYGSESAEVAISLNNEGEILVALGRPEEALDLLNHSVTIWQSQVGAADPKLGNPLTALGRALLALERPKSALAPLERGLQLRESGEPNGRLVAETRFALARALWDASRDRARALTLAKTARDAYSRAGDLKKVADVEAWLSACSDLAGRRPGKVVVHRVTELQSERPSR
jgi:tetratricopeptide (TPR) repeat protein